MAELSQIETYERLIGEDYLPTINRFTKVLKSIGLWNNALADSLNKFEWKVEDNGFVYNYNRVNGPPLYLSGIEIIPIITGYTPQIDPTFSDNWIGCSLCIPTAQIRHIEYFINAYNVIKPLMRSMHEEFKQTGVYLTDEAQDGIDFDGIRCDNPNYTWQFDYALIPSTFSELYKERQNTHKVIEHSGYLEVWHIDRWKDGDI